MAEALKNLGQLLPATQTLDNLYSVPSGASAVVSTIIVCNRGSQPSRFRIAHAIGAAADDPKQYLYYEEMIPANKSFPITLGITLASSDQLRVYSGNGQMSFNAYGSEITP